MSDTWVSEMLEGISWTIVLWAALATAAACVAYLLILAVRMHFTAAQFIAIVKKEKPHLD